MTISYRILKGDGDNRIEFRGRTYAEDELHETIWQINREIRSGLPKNERIEAQGEIRQYQELLTALRSGGP